MTAADPESSAPDQLAADLRFPLTDPLSLRAQRMDAMARLAGVIAHDLNNVLTVVLGHAEMLADVLPDSGPARESALEIRNAADGAARLANQLLALSGRQPLAPEPVDVNELLYEMAETLGQIAGAELELRFDLASSLPMVEIDPRQLARVIRNLVTDARYANGGRLTIATRTSRSGTATDVVLMLSDARGLLPGETVSRMFEPVVGTRGGPRGAGLDRAASYGIVGQAGGRLDVTQAPTGGLTFTIAFPAKS